MYGCNYNEKQGKRKDNKSKASIYLMCKDVNEQFALRFHPYTNFIQQQFIIFHMFKHFDTYDAISKVMQLWIIESHNVA